MMTTKQRIVQAIPAVSRIELLAASEDARTRLLRSPEARPSTQAQRDRVSSHQSRPVSVRSMAVVPAVAPGADRAFRTIVRESTRRSTAETVKHDLRTCARSETPLETRQRRARIARLSPRRGYITWRFCGGGSSPPFTSFLTFILHITKSAERLFLLSSSSLLFFVTSQRCSPPPA